MSSDPNNSDKINYFVNMEVLKPSPNKLQGVTKDEIYLLGLDVDYDYIRVQSSSSFRIDDI